MKQRKKIGLKRNQLDFISYLWTLVREAPDAQVACPVSCQTVRGANPCVGRWAHVRCSDRVRPVQICSLGELSGSCGCRASDVGRASGATSGVMRL